MKRNLKMALAVLSATLMCISMTGCGGDSKSSITDKDIEKAAEQLDKDLNQSATSENEEIDPFEGVDISCDGISPNIRVEREGGNSYVKYKIDREGERFKNGDKVIITAESSAYNLTQTEKEFIVSGCPEYLQTLEDIPQDVYNGIDENCRSSYEAFLAENYSATLKNIELLGNYMLTAKTGSFEEGNYVYFVYKVDVDFSNVDAEIGEREYYICSYYADMIAEADGTVTVDYDEISKGTLDYIFTVDAWNVEGAETLDKLYADNVTSRIDKYECVSTVK